ncbi:MAG: pilus assembly protein TadG-related protein [Candidatus Obscuribacterales bacterium]
MAERLRRNRHGNMLILIIAFTFIVLALALVGLNFMRLIGTNSEQRTATEAAAIAAARDLSMIVVNTPECGYVALSDYAPAGSGTNAGDGYPLPVRSINTLIGTARLDLIIGDLMGQQVMIDLANKDMQDVLSAKDQLLSVLNNACLPGGTGNDKDGNVVSPYVSAETAYTQNQIRMTGASSLIPGSLYIQLGCITGGLSTAVPVPKPAGSAPVPPAQQVNGFYRSYVNVPYNGTDFVFAGIGPNIKIVDQKKWVATIPGLPYQIPTIVRVEATQEMDASGAGTVGLVNTVACAQPSTVYDPLPEPGALSISFPDGAPPEITHPSDIYNNADLQAGLVDLLTAKNGDYPIDIGSSMVPANWPVMTGMPTSNVWLAAFHDWIRRAGTKADIASILNMQNQTLDPANPSTASWVAPVVHGGAYVNLGMVPAGIIHVFKFDTDGVVTYQSRLLTPYPLYVSSEEQMYAETMLALPNSSVTPQTYSVPLPSGAKDITLLQKYDIYIRDEVRNPGTIRGGKHAGEPLAKPLVVERKVPPSAGGKVMVVSPRRSARKTSG